jgi:thiol-disulfide isomerase/thioredoxin
LAGSSIFYKDSATSKNEVLNLLILTEIGHNRTYFNMGARDFAIIIAFSGCFCAQLPAQLPSGSVAPDFAAYDVGGNLQHLYSVLDSGKIVVMEVSATWCPPCWAYHQSGELQEFFLEHGPGGDNRARVLWVEGDEATNIECILGLPGCSVSSPGNYSSGVTYPLLDNSAIGDTFRVAYYPTLYVICPNKKLYETDARPADALWDLARTCPVAYGQSNAGIYEFYPGYELPEICGEIELNPSFQLTNLGFQPLTQADIRLRWNGADVGQISWTGLLGIYEDTLISFTTQPVSDEGVVSVQISSVNGNAGDDNNADNFRSAVFGNSAYFHSTELLLKIRTDDYGQETYWELRDENGQVIESGGNELVGPDGGGKFPLGVTAGAGSLSSNTIVKDTLYLPMPGCYSIHFVDAFGDGICCQYGNGYYRLFDLSDPSTPVISGGMFTEYDRHALESGTTISADEVISHGEHFEVFPNPASGSLDFGQSGCDWSDWTICNLSGQVVQRSRSRELPDVTDLPNGLYCLCIRLNSGVQMIKLVVQH